MRIIAGKYKGQIIKCPKGQDVRPTTDRVKESMFSSLTSILESFDNICVFDAFAGTGSLGFEALSRGAKRLISTEKNYRTYKNLLDNAKSLNINNEDLQILNLDVLVNRVFHKNTTVKFNLIFLDPPYKFEPDQVLKVLLSLVDDDLLATDCIVVYEHSANTELDSFVNIFKQHSFVVINDKIYGDVSITYLKYKG